MNSTPFRLGLRSWILVGLIAGLGSGCTGEAHEHSHDDSNAHGHSGEAKHVHVAPHGGTLVVFGEEFAHLELVFEPNTGTALVYVLDGEAEKGLRVPENELSLKIEVPERSGSLDLVVAATESSLTGETVGDSSRFSGRSEALVGVERFSATLGAITLRGTTFRDTPFRFPEGNEGDAHDTDHGHDADHDDDHDDDAGHDHDADHDADHDGKDRG